MGNCDKIKAHVFMEEKYERISLSYGVTKISNVKYLIALKK